ncbi:hypothetical protein ACFE04_031817 [Oxalis oulophora]
MDGPSSWDALRKQARKLEAQLDEQMNSYRKLISRKASSTKADAAEADVESGIEWLLKQLHQVNLHMQQWVSSGGSEMVSHTLTRHQEILQDLTQEFYRLQSSLRAKQEHASLLDGFREFDHTRLDLGDGDQALLREHAAISRSTGQMDDVISQAQATLGTLVHQRSTFGGINLKIGNIGSRLPTINQVLSSIKRKKSMDAIILSLIASACTVMIFIYCVIHARKSAVSSTSLKWTLVIISSLAISVAGFLFGITAILHRDEGGVIRCVGGRPRSVRVVWDQHGNDDDFTVMGLELSRQRSQFRLSLQLDGSIDLIIKTERIDGA